jgi:hypothetical protein
LLVSHVACEVYGSVGHWGTIVPRPVKRQCLWGTTTMVIVRKEARGGTSPARCTKEATTATIMVTLISITP